MMSKELRDNKGIISTQYFGNDQGESYLPYSKNWNEAITKIDFETNELVLTLISKQNSTCNREIRVKL